MSKGLHRFAILPAFWTLVLTVAGGRVTGNHAGLPVPAWPLSYGKLMPNVEGGIFYQHGHRMVASVDGMLMIVMSVWLWTRDERRWLKRLGFALLPVHRVRAIELCQEWLEEAHEFGEILEPPARCPALITALCVRRPFAVGAAARHKALGNIWHIRGSSIVTGVVLWFTVRILLHYRDHAALRKSALAVSGITLRMAASVMAGIEVYRNVRVSERECAAQRVAIAR